MSATWQSILQSKYGIYYIGGAPKITNLIQMTYHQCCVQALVVCRKELLMNFLNDIKVDFDKASWIFTDEADKRHINTQKLYMHIKENYPIIITPISNYIYNNGVYMSISETNFKAFIKEFIPVEIRKKKLWEAVYNEFITSFTVSERSFNNDENIINFKNGVLKVDTNELLPHNKDILSTIQIPCNYIHNADLNNAPVFKQYLQDLVGDDELTKQFLLEYMGAILSNVPGYKFKKLLMLLGPGNTGKTQLREFIISLIGEHNSISIDLKNLNDTFGTSQLPNKRLAGCGDMSYACVAEINILKELTGGDDMLANPKYKPLFSFKYKGFLWYNCNDLPKFGGDTGAHVYERFNIVHCKNIIPDEKRDPYLLEKMLKEKDIIASVCIQYFKKAIERGYKFTESDSIKDSRIKYIVENNTLLSFVENYCHVGVGKTKRSDFNAEYKAWCRENKLHAEKSSDIAKILFNHYGLEAHKSSDYYYNLTVETEYIQEINAFVERMRDCYKDNESRRQRLKSKNQL